MVGRNLGVSFAPTLDNAEESGERAAREGLPAAIKMLSLRLPRVLGAKAPVAAPLLQSQGMAGLGQAEQQLFQALTRILGGGNDLGMMGDTQAPGGWKGSGPGIPNPATPPNVPGIPPSAPGPAPIPKISLIPKGTEEGGHQPMRIPSHNNAFLGRGRLRQ
jgi:hypothetical protein